MSNTERNVVLIDDVSPSNQTVQVTDMRGGKFTLTYSGAGSLLVPAKGDSWIIQRNDFAWELIDRYESSSDIIKNSELNPGDNRISSTTELKLAAPVVSINRQPLGVTTWDRFDIPHQGLWNVALSHNPIVKSVMAFNNGGLVDPSYLKINTNIVDGNPKIKFANGSLVIYYQYIPS